MEKKWLLVGPSLSHTANASGSISCPCDVPPMPNCRQLVATPIILIRRLLNISYIPSQAGFPPALLPQIGLGRDSF